MNRQAFMAGYLGILKQADNPLWNKAKNEWSGGKVNPLNWAGRAYDAPLDALAGVVTDAAVNKRVSTPSLPKGSIWNKRKNEYSGGHKNPLNWGGRAMDAPVATIADTSRPSQHVYAPAAKQQVK